MQHSKSEIDSGWEVRSKDDAQKDWLAVPRVPTQVHMDLLANNKIPDPFQDFNERAVQWVGEKDWVYRTSFRAPATQDAQDQVTTDLVFEGLDTFATVTLNGNEILKTDNMFVEYRVNVTDRLKRDGDNHLEIVFDSALLRGRQLVEEHKHEHTFYVRQTEAGRVPIRKAQYNWGWDWGPILMTAGPWKPVYLEQYVAKIEDVWVDSTISDDLTVCSGKIFTKLAGSLRGDETVVVALTKDGAAAYESSPISVSGTSPCEATFKINNPALWYPIGYGQQSRYELQARLVRPDQPDQPLHSPKKLIGFRRAELVQEPDAHGKSFYFRVNNIDIFAGGSCWIPCDSFLSQIEPQRYHDWVRLVAEGNQVLLRIWGGGAYEHDALLDACDELGVLVWHDFQFACASYPTYQPYLDSVELEARQQVRRLRTHPSVVIWAGNNEDYQVQEKYGLEYNYEGDKDPESWLESSFPARYIYEYLLPKLVEEEQPGMIYHPSSPWGDGKPWADPTVGDTHQWHLWHGSMFKYQEASSLGSRFVSEFGMEGYPHLSTVRRMTTDPSQLYPGSLVLDFHNKAIHHERRMMTYVIENFRQPIAASTHEDQLASYAHLTQIAQAETMRAAYKAWRRDWGSAGDRRCGGVLVWQINDCWPTASWAVVDYYLVKKPAYYAIARALRSVDVGVHRTYNDWTATGEFVDKTSDLKTGQVDQTLPARSGNTFDVWVASNDLKSLDVTITTRFISVKSGKDVCEATQTSVVASANATTEAIHSQPLPPSIPDPDDVTKPFSTAQYDPYVIHATLRVGDKVVSCDTAWPEPIKFLDLSDRGVRVEAASPNRVVVSADRPVKGFVFEEVEGMKLSDNGFDVLPGEPYTVTVEGPVKADQLKWIYVDAPRRA